MGWFWKSKSIKAEVADVPSLEQTLQEEVDRLQAVNAESLRLQAEWQASAEAAEASRVEADEIFANERKQTADQISELNRKNEELESNLAASQQKRDLLDEANISMAQMIREREAVIQQRDLRQTELEADLAAISTRTSAQIADLTQQLSKVRDEASSQINELEKRLAAESATAVDRITKLEQQLAESEARSASRAEQRSALLRNMAEIHRLSTTSSKSDVQSESLKLINPGWNEQSESESA